MIFMSWLRSPVGMCTLTRWYNVSPGMVGLSGVVYELAWRVRVPQLSALTCLRVSKYSVLLCRTPEVRALIRKGQGFIQFSKSTWVRVSLCRTCHCVSCHCVSCHCVSCHCVSCHCVSCHCVSCHCDSCSFTKTKNVSQLTLTL